jgi:hypothetical protein
MVLDKPRKSSKEVINRQRDKVVKERRDFLYGHRDKNDQIRPINIEEKITHVLPDIRKDLENLRQQEIPPVGHQPEILVQRERQVNQIRECLAQLDAELKEALQRIERKSPEEQKWGILEKWAGNSVNSEKDIKSGTDSLDPKKLKEMQQSLDVLLESAKDEAINIKAYKYIGELKNESSRYGIERFDISADVDRYVQTIREMKQNLNNPAFSRSLKQAFREKNPDEQTLKLRSAANFYQGMIRPLLATRKDAFSPRAEYIDNLCNKLISNEGANVVLYYALSKTQSSSRTNSPDNIIDMAEVEMLRHYSLMARVAQKSGLNLRFTIMNERDCFPNDSILGFNHEEMKINAKIAKMTIKEFGAEELVIIRSLQESITNPLGDDFSHLYKEKQEDLKERIWNSVKNNTDDPLKIRVFTTLDSTPDKNLESFGITSSEGIEKIRAMTKKDDLNELPIELLTSLIEPSASFTAYMDLRAEAGNKVRSNNKTDEYPEYDPNSIRAGITWSKDRLSLKPSLKRFESRTVNPMHGLAVYAESSTGKEYAGIAQYRNLQSKQNIEIVRLNGKPIFAVQNALNEIGALK